MNNYDKIDYTELNNREVKFDSGAESRQLSIVVIGHVDAGKSTLVGQLMSSVNEQVARMINKQLGEAEMLKKESFL